MTTKGGFSLKKHAIQIENVFVKELFIVANQPPSEQAGVEAGEFKLSVGHSEYDRENKRIGVSVKLEVGFSDAEEEQTKLPFSMRIEIVGQFNVDEESFPIEHITHWARTNAPLILFPYLREHAYSLSVRCGFRPMLLPLMEVPTYKLPQKK
jgi:preprotein translocase subunit SecB